MKKKIDGKWISIVVFITLSLSFLYISIRLFFFLFTDLPFIDKFLAAVLLTGEFFGLTHSIGYLFSLLTTVKNKQQNISNKETPPLTDFPSVAIVVPSYKEPLEVLEDTLTCLHNLSYPNKQLYLLDDTPYDKPWDTEENKQIYCQAIEDMCKELGINLFRRKWRAAKAGIINDFIKFREKKELENLSFYHFQHNLNLGKEKYLIVFDADVNPLPDFVEPLVYHMENCPKAAFIQTPQYYTNFETNRVARAAGLQQVIFFEYICESKGEKDAMICCGSNVMLRMEALEAVGGLDESSVTEDFATSLLLHIQGWRSLYYSKVCAFGMGPEDLKAYFKQQYRWAFGTVTLAKKLPLLFIKEFKKISLRKWWEYYLSSTYYFTGIFFFIMACFPPIFLLFDIPTYFINPSIYLVVFFPYLIMSLFTAFWTLYLRSYKPIYLLNSMIIAASSFPILIKACIYSLMGRKTSFTVTPKCGSSILPLKYLWPQLALLSLCLFSAVWGIERLYYEREPFFGILINVIWSILNTLILSSVLYFNNPEGESWLKKS